MDPRQNGAFPNAFVERMSRRSALHRFGVAGATAALVAALGRGGAGVAQQDGPPEEWFLPDATLGRHGQIILGAGPVYLSHLPMFMFDTPDSHPHHFQVILEVTFDADAQSDYLADRQANTAPLLYTLHPTDKYRMLDLIASDPGQPALRSLSGNIVRGHFERGDDQPFGIEMANVHSNATVDVVRVVYAHEFEFHPAPLAQLEYVLFGQGESLYLAHRITQPPDFDQILPVRIEGHVFTDDELQGGIVISVPDRANTILERLKGGEQVVGIARRTGMGGTIADDLQIVADPELFFEEGELRFPLTPSDFDPTQAEIDAKMASVSRGESTPATPAPVEVVVEIAGFAFVPEMVEVAVGSTVTWTNQDAAPHSVAGDHGEFDSGDLAPGQSFSFTFGAPGTFAYHCDFHPMMEATVVAK
jgi:plastocyanin